MLPSYINEVLKAYFEVSSEDRRALLDEELFDFVPLSCDERYLPLLAVEMGVDISGFEVDKQREIIDDANNSFIMSGTVHFLKKSLLFAGDLKVDEIGGYTFDIDLSMSDMQITPTLAQKIQNIANKKKNVRSVLRELKLSYLEKNRLNIKTGGVSEVGQIAKQIEGYSMTALSSERVACGGVAEVVAYA